MTDPRRDPGRDPLRVLYYYGEGQPRALSETNPYGHLLAGALERRGVTVTYATRHDEGFLRDQAASHNVVHLHWPHYEYADPDRDTMERQMLAFAARLRLARELGYKVVWTAHNVYPHNRRHHEINHAFRIELCRIATAVIAHCEVSAEAVRTTFGRTERLFVIPHGHFIGTHPPLLDRADARASYGIPDDAYVLGFFGNIQPYKGLEELLDAFARLSGDAWLVISGGGFPDHRASIGDRIAAAHLPRVVYRHFDFAPGIEIIRVLAASDACPVPFRATTTSGSLILALSWGRPVVAPALGCLPDTVLPGAGVLYPADEPGALGRALEEVRRFDPAVAAERALASVRRFDWDTIADRTIEAYRA